MPPKLHQLQNVVAHEGIINSMTIGHRTSQVFATGGEDRHLNLWQVGSRNPRSSFGPFQSSITACRFNSTEEMIVCGNNGGTVLLFDLNESRCSSNWTAHTAQVKSIKFHPQDQRIVLSCSNDGKLKVLSTSQRKPIQTYNAHSGAVNWVSYSSDGKYCATCGDDKTIRVFDLTAQKQLLKFDDAHNDSITCVEFHPSQPLLISSSDDRSIKFWDIEKQCEIPVSFALDSSPVEVVMFCPQDNKIALSASADYIKVVGYNPPEMFDYLTLGLERVHDISVDYSNSEQSTLTIASSSSNQALIYRVKLNDFKSFSEKVVNPEQIVKNEVVRPTTPRLLDLSTMQIAQQAASKTPITSKPTSNVTVKAKKIKNSTGPKSKNTSTLGVRSARSNDKLANDDIEKSSFRSASTVKSSKPMSANDSNETKVFTDYRKYRGSFISAMNEKYSRLSRVKDSLEQVGLTKTLENAVETEDLSVEILSVLRMKPEVVKLEHAASVMQIAVHAFDRDYDLAIITVESMLQAFGKLVATTRQIASNGVGFDTALEERKRISEMFVDAFREIAPKMRTVACGKSQISQTAAELLEEWKMLLR